MTKRGRWLDARHLKPGDQIYTRSGELATVEIVESRIENSIPVFNIHVDTAHTYAVGIIGLLVHNRIPRNNGHWDGEAGNSNWHSYNDDVNIITGGKPVPFKNGRPDFDSFSFYEIIIEKGKLNGSKKDFSTIYKEIVNRSRKIRTLKQARNWLKKWDITPHHMSETIIQLIPRKLHSKIPHIRSASDMRNLLGSTF